MKKLIMMVFAGCVVMFSAVQAHAGFLLEPTLPAGVQILGASIPGFNDDNVSSASLGPIFDQLPTDFNYIVLQKSFKNLDPIDISFSVLSSGGTTEYYIVEVISNETGYAWYDYHTELGIGGGDSFLKLSAVGADGLGLDFDTPDKDPAPSSLFLGDGTIFSLVQQNPDSILWKNGVIPANAPGTPISELAFITYSLDVPDLDPNGYSFTLRQYPSVPEPATLLMMVTGLAGAFARRRFFA